MASGLAIVDVMTGVQRGIELQYTAAAAADVGWMNGAVRGLVLSLSAAEQEDE